jgi:hypothetical protein
VVRVHPDPPLQRSGIGFKTRVSSLWKQIYNL